MNLKKLVMMMLLDKKEGEPMTPIEKLISVAEAEVGYCEKSKVAVQINPNVLDEKVAGAGADNMTKYARSLVNWVGSPFSQGSAWCDLFTDWCFITAFGLKTAKDMIGGWSAYTPSSAQFYKNMGRWYGTPKVGDQIFFKNESRICHTGIVYAVNDTHVYTIEGNTSSNVGVVTNGGCVAKKQYALTYSKIAGYGRPKYELAQSVPTTKAYLYKGVDVSSAQTNMDYAKLKQAGVDFAIIKIIRKDLTPDLMFEKHYSGFTNAQIPVFAVYNYSYATTVEKAKKDAQVVISTLRGRRVAVCLDVEDNVQKGLGKTLVDIINAYQSVIESAGLPFILYTGMSFFATYINPWKTYLNCKDIWMARYPSSQPMSFNEDPNQSKCPMDGILGWQYTSHGIVDGYNGHIDCDILYRDIASPTVSKKNIVTTVKTRGSKLNVRKQPIGGNVVDKLSNKTVVKIVDIDYASGWYKLGNERYVSPNYIESNTIGVITAYNLNIRNQDSTKGNIVGRYVKDESVTILCQSSTGWYLTPKGWISNNYVREV